jgi:hypothetical protein
MVQKAFRGRFVPNPAKFQKFDSPRTASLAISQPIRPRIAKAGCTNLNTAPGLDQNGQMRHDRRHDGRNAFTRNLHLRDYYRLAFAG